MLSLKETFVEDDVWVLVSVISKKKVVPSSLLKQRKAVQRHGFIVRSHRGNVKSSTHTHTHTHTHTRG